MNQLTTALVDALGPLVDVPTNPYGAISDSDRERIRLAMAIAEQLDGRVRGRSLPES